MCNQTEYVQLQYIAVLPLLCFLYLTISRIRLSNSRLLFLLRSTPPSLPPSLPPSALARYSSISSIRSSPSRELSAVTWTALTVPANGELTTVSIFMAERTHSGWPFSTFHDYKDSSQSIKNTSQEHRPLKKFCSWRLATETHKEVDINGA